MERCTYLEIAGKVYPMRMTLAAEEKIREKYGSINGMCEKFADENECITTYLDVMELLIAQGCAYKNTFEKDLPAPKGSAVENGEYKTLDRNLLSVALGKDDIPRIVDAIAITAGLSKKTEIHAESDGKSEKKTKSSEKS